MKRIFGAVMKWSGTLVLGLVFVAIVGVPLVIGQGYTPHGTCPSHSWNAGYGSQTTGADCSQPGYGDLSAGFSAEMDAVLGSTRGGLAERGSAGWANLPPGGTAGQFLQSQGSGADPAYASAKALIIGQGSGSDATLAGATVDFVPGAQGGAWCCAVPVPYAGTLSNLQFWLGSPPGSGQSVTLTLYHNYASTGLTCVVSGSTSQTCSDTTHTQSVNAGDVIAFVAVGSSGAASSTIAAGVQVASP